MRFLEVEQPQHVYLVDTFASQSGVVIGVEYLGQDVFVVCLARPAEQIADVDVEVLHAAHQG